MTALLTPDEAAAVLRVSARTLDDWRQAGGGPAFVRVGRLVRYRVEDVESYCVQSLRRHATDERTERQERAGARGPVALPVQVARPGIQRVHRFGRRTLKSERGGGIRAQGPGAGGAARAGEGAIG